MGSTMRDISPGAGGEGTFHLADVVGCAEAGKLGEDRCCHRHHKNCRHKSGDPVGIAEGGNTSLRQHRSDGPVHHGIELGDSLPQEDGENHHQQMADIFVTKIKAGAEAEPFSFGGDQQHHKRRPVTDHHSPAQPPVMLLVGKADGENNSNIQRHAHHTHSKKAAVDLEIALKNIVDADEKDGDHHQPGKLHRQVPWCCR